MRFRSRWARQARAPYTMPTTASAPSHGAIAVAPSGRTGMAILAKPYVPIFSNTPASSTEPTVGASVCASGSQVCSGHMGVFTARPMPIATNARIWMDLDIPAPWDALSATMSRVPVWAQIRSRPSSMTTEPSSV